MKRISPDIYKQVKYILKSFVYEVMTDAHIYSEQARRFTICTIDVVRAARRGGINLYGY